MSDMIRVAMFVLAMFLNISIKSWTNFFCWKIGNIKNLNFQQKKNLIFLSRTPTKTNAK